MLTTIGGSRDLLSARPDNNNPLTCSASLIISYRLGLLSFDPEITVEHTFRFSHQSIEPPHFWPRARRLIVVVSEA